jgi:predicted secreted hydrolase
VVRPTIPNQEMLDLGGLNGYHQSYWEGSCTVTGTRAGHAVSGKAYTELTGYGGSSEAP